LNHKTLVSAALAVAFAGLAGCADKAQAPKTGQALASVNGEEITAMQLNEELQRANVQAAQQEAASKQMLEGLIDRQLLQNEAAKDKTDRDPKVVQAIERAKAMIIAQAYMQKKIGDIPKPSATEVSDYYSKHPDFFANRKQFDMKQLVIDTKDLSDEVKQFADNSKSLDDVASWFDEHKVKYVRTQASRTTSDLSPEMSGRLKNMKPGQLFVVKEGPRSMFVSIADVKDNPASLELAAPQIERFLVNQRSKAAADAELARLRAVAKIEYLNKAAMTASAAPAAAPAALSTPAPEAHADDATARGVAGLK
jgi:peptidyl-prolyl cis-trans isomerase C